MEKIIFCADLHGNMEQYKRVLNHAKAKSADIVLFGGDLTPKDPDKRTPVEQRKFFEEELFPLLKNFIHNTKIEVLMIMGNDDFRSNHPLFVKGQSLYGYKMIDEEPYTTKLGFTFVGYSYVPFTPFRYKCWEKKDRKHENNLSHRGEGILTEGVISKGSELVPYLLKEKLEETSIEEDLEEITKGMNMDKLILVIHTPPYGTVCDFNRENKHVGSKAVREFIEKHQPYATLHGHIHETVDLKGSYIEKLGKTVCIAVGNDHKPARPYIIELQLEEDFKSARVLVE